MRFHISGIRVRSLSMVAAVVLGLASTAGAQQFGGFGGGNAGFGGGQFGGGQGGFGGGGFGGFGGGGMGGGGQVGGAGGGGAGLGGFGGSMGGRTQLTLPAQVGMVQTGNLIMSLTGEPGTWNRASLYGANSNLGGGNAGFGNGGNNGGFRSVAPSPAASSKNRRRRGR